jgi:two-component system heavy metal sensor histidine kinase CusS
MKHPSIRNSLLVRCGIGVGALMLALSISIYYAARHGLYKEIDRSIKQTAALLGNQIELENNELTFEWQEGIGTNKQLIDAGLFQFWNEATGEITRSAGLRSFDLPKFCGPDGTPELRDIKLPQNGRHARAIGIRVYPFVLPEEMARMKESGQLTDPRSLPHILVVAQDAKPVHYVLTRLRWILGLGTLTTLGIGFFLINRAIRHSLQPIEMLSEQVTKREGNRLDSALELSSKLPSELTGLAESFDSLLSRVASLRMREKDFIRNAAHELRTPIAGLRATIELALNRPRSAEEYQSKLESCHSQVAAIGELLNRLSALARMGNAKPLRPEKINITEILNHCLQNFQTRFDQRYLTVTRKFAQTPCHANGDATLATMIIKNLLDNAACYSPESSQIDVKISETNGHVRVLIQNRSDELPDELDRLFEPLFRKDSSRQNEGSHLGIGLSLSLEAANAMGGKLLAQKTADGLIGFSFILPCGA